MPRIEYQQGLELVDRALQHGAQRVSAYRTVWDLSSSCAEPSTVFYDIRPPCGVYDKYITVAPYTKQPLLLEVTVRCRKCEPCLRYRAAMWRHRAREETSAAPRTWFGTLTFTAEGHLRNKYEAAVQSRSRQRVDFEELSPHEQYLHLARLSGREVTKFLKRLRKDARTRFRYLAVAEPHKSGNPHWHLLVHETSFMEPIRKRTLQGCWKSGFSSFKLADTSAPGYLCKYIAKDLGCRVRASQAYGDPSGRRDWVSLVKDVLKT